MVYIGDLPKLKNFVALWNFNIGVNGKIVKSGISWKRLIVEGKGRKFGTRGTFTVHMCRVLLVPNSLSLVWGHSVHFAKFPMLRFSKGYCSPSFRSNWTKFYYKHVGHMGIQSVTVFGDLPKFKNFMTLLSQFSSNSSKLYTRYHNHIGCHFFWRSAKNFKNYGTLKFS